MGVYQSAHNIWNTRSPKTLRRNQVRIRFRAYSLHKKKILGTKPTHLYMSSLKQSAPKKSGRAYTCHFGCGLYGVNDRRPVELCLAAHRMNGEEICNPSFRDILGEKPRRVRRIRQHPSRARDLKSPDRKSFAGTSRNLS